MKTTRLLLLLLLLPVASFAQVQPLPLEQAFSPAVTIQDPHTLALKFTIHPDYFLYRHKLVITPDTLPKQALGNVLTPHGDKKHDALLGNYEAFHGSVSVALPILAEKPGEYRLNLHYQGCADDGFCYPPTDRPIVFHVNEKLAITYATVDPVSAKVVATEEEKATKLLESKHWAWIVLSFFGLGLLLSFTPCVLPMLPVLSTIIAGHSENLHTKKALALSVTYVLGMSITYAGIGLVIALLGYNLQISLQHPVSLLLATVLLIVLALALLDVIHFRLPHRWQHWINQLSKKQHHGTYWGTAAMGALATLVLSPCVTPPLVAVLGYIAHTGDHFIGAVALFAMGLGMGTPLIFIGTTLGHWLPKVGPWMRWIKILFALVLLGLAFHLTARVFPILAHPIDYLNGHVEQSTVPFKAVKTIADVEKQLKATKKPVLLDFYADWCISCQHLEHSVFPHELIKPELKRFILLKADVTANDAKDNALMQHYQVIAPPTLLLFDSKGKVTRMVGEVSVGRLREVLRAVH